MPDESYTRLQQIMEAALRVTPPHRAAFIQSACADDAALFAEAKALLPHYEQMQDYEPSRSGEWFLPGTTTIGRAQSEAAAAAEQNDPKPPFSIGEYECDEVLGRGGMGIVYRARHTTLRRRVAIKLLRGGMLSSDDRWRFAFEAELLRRLQHPGIARIFHVNEVRWRDEPRPYFVMELVCGKTLVQFAEQAQLNALERLVLFANVCEPIEFAHHRGIVHRDLKPGNILVDESGNPRILDFGIARIQDFTPASQTGGGQFIGTPEYASPEQLCGPNDQLTPRSDVYALGLIAHELLAGALPKTVNGRLQLELGRINLEGCPPELTTRQPEFLHCIRVILSASLASSPSRRYRSAGVLGGGGQRRCRRVSQQSRLAIYPRSPCPIARRPADKRR